MGVSPTQRSVPTVIEARKIGRKMGRSCCRGLYRSPNTIVSRPQMSSTANWHLAISTRPSTFLFHRPFAPHHSPITRRRHPVRFHLLDQSFHHVFSNQIIYLSYRHPSLPAVAGGPSLPLLAYFPILFASTAPSGLACLHALQQLGPKLGIYGVCHLKKKTKEDYGTKLWFPHLAVGPR
jgi:hypothetical protein